MNHTGSFHADASCVYTLQRHHHPQLASGSIVQVEPITMLFLIADGVVPSANICPLACQPVLLEVTLLVSYMYMSSWFVGCSAIQQSAAAYLVAWIVGVELVGSVIPGSLIQMRHGDAAAVVSCHETLQPRICLCSCTPAASSKDNLHSIK